MDEVEFRELVERCQLEAQMHPDRYRRRVITLVGIGYAYVVGVLGLLVLLTVVPIVAGGALHLGFAVIKLAILAGGPALVLARSVFFTLPEPEGEPVELEDAPDLYRMLGELHERLDAPQVEAVLLVNEFNAAVATRAGAGAFNSRHFLLIGLPLMQALTPDQFRAVMAHELGHLSRSHGKLGAYIYSARGMWSDLLATLESRRNWSQGLFKSFLRWYAPHFNATTFVLAREQEYEADRASADLVSPAMAAEALTRIEIAGGLYHDRYLPALFSEAKREPLPVSGIFERFDEMLRAPTPATDRRLWLERARSRVAGVADTHPSYRERLAALGVPEVQDPPAPVSLASSAAMLLGSRLPQLEGDLERRWKGRVLGQWESIHREAIARRQSLEAIDRRGQKESLSLDDRFQQAALSLDVVGHREGQAMLETLLAAEPDHLPTLFLAGTIRLEDRDESGIALLERAMDLDAECVPAACEVAINYFESHGLKSQAEPFRERARRHRELVEKAQLERGELRPDEVFEPHGLREEEIEALRAEMAETEDIEEAYLVRRSLQSMPEHPQRVLGVHPYRQLMTREQNEVVQRIRTWFTQSTAFPNGTMLVLLNRAPCELVMAIKQVAGSRVL